MPENRKVFLFRIDQALWNSDEQVLDAFHESGVQVDSQFGLVPIDNSGERKVLRGESTDSINEILKEKYDVDAFVDVSVGPLVKK